MGVHRVRRAKVADMAGATAEADEEVMVAEAVVVAVEADLEEEGAGLAADEEAEGEEASDHAGQVDPKDTRIILGKKDGDGTPMAPTRRRT